jgi:hypothetical protein
MQIAQSFHEAETRSCKSFSDFACLWRELRARLCLGEAVVCCHVPSQVCVLPCPSISLSDERRLSKYGSRSKSRSRQSNATSLLLRRPRPTRIARQRSCLENLLPGRSSPKDEANPSRYAQRHRWLLHCAVGDASLDSVCCPRTATGGESWIEAGSMRRRPE